MEAADKITVYYDGACYICAHEIDLYRKRDKANKIDFADISLGSFDAAAEGLDPDEIQRVFHVRNREGSILTGVDGFIAIWDEIPSLNFLAKLGRNGFVRMLLNVGYKGFVVIRPYLPRRKCETDSCKI